MKYAIALKVGFRLQDVKDDLSWLIGAIDTMDKELTEKERNKIGKSLRKAYKEMTKASTDYTPIMSRNW